VERIEVRDHALNLQSLGDQDLVASGQVETWALPPAKSKAGERDAMMNERKLVMEQQCHNWWKRCAFHNLYPVPSLRSLRHPKTERLSPARYGVSDLRL